MNPNLNFTDEQIRSTYFVRHDVVHVPNIVSAGGAHCVVGWPDGTTVVVALRDRSEPIDTDALVHLYRAAEALTRWSLARSA